MTKAKKPMRSSWVKWPAVLVVIGTCIAVFVLYHIHPNTPVDISLRVQEVSFRTNSTEMFSPANHEEFTVSRVATVSIQGPGVKLKVGTRYLTGSSELELHGDPSASCTFQSVRTGPFRLSGDSSLKLLWLKHDGELSFAMTSHGPMSGHLTAKPDSQLPSGFACTRMSLNGAPSSTVECALSSRDSVYFTTAIDTQLGFRSQEKSGIEGTNITVLDDVRLSHIEVGAIPKEITVLLAPLPGQRNEILFEAANKNAQLAVGDLVLIKPDKNFYIRKFEINGGIQLSLHGIVKGIDLSAGSQGPKSIMPSLFDEWDNNKRAITVIPGIVAFVLLLLKGGTRSGKTGHDPED